MVLLISLIWDRFGGGSLDFCDLGLILVLIFDDLGNLGFILLLLLMLSLIWGIDFGGDVYDLGLILVGGVHDL